MNNSSAHDHNLQELARQSMIDHGFDPEFPSAALEQVRQITAQAKVIAPSVDVRDLRSLLWSSIDNETSRDLDQVEVAEQLADGSTKVLIGIADVDAFVPKDSPIDEHASKQTTSVYTGVRIFPMLPEELSTGLTSLLQDQDRLAVVIEYVVDGNGGIVSSDLYRALVRNKAQLAYPAVGAWLEGRGEVPAAIAKSPEIQAQVKLQDEVAQAL